MSESTGDAPDEQYLDKVISDLHKDALGFRPDQEFGREWMSSSFEEKLEIYNNLLKSLNSDMDEGIGGMIAGGVGQFIGNKIDPLHGEIMRAHGEMAGRKAEYTIRKYMHLLQKALKQQLDSGDNKDESMQEGRKDYGYDSFGNSLRPGDDEGSTEPPNNFAIYINGKKWKVFQGKGHYADDQYEMQQFRQLQAMAARKSQETGKKWEVARTGEPATK